MVLGMMTLDVGTLENKCLNGIEEKNLGYLAL
jgi:hypothetical protein